jgi:hypothetical protein
MRYLPAVGVLWTLAYLASASVFSWSPWSAKTIDAALRISLLGFLATLVLLAITWVYVLTTRDQLAEARKRAKEEDAVQVMLSVRVPAYGRETAKLGIGEGLFKEGPPIYLDVWNFGRPAFMVMEVQVAVGQGNIESLRPQELVSGGQIVSIPVTHILMGLASDFRGKG